MGRKRRRRELIDRAEGGYSSAGASFGGGFRGLRGADWGGAMWYCRYECACACEKSGNGGRDRREKQEGGT